MKRYTDGIQNARFLCIPAAHPFAAFSFQSEHKTIFWKILLILARYLPCEIILFIKPSILSLSGALPCTVPPTSIMLASFASEMVRYLCVCLLHTGRCIIFYAEKVLAFERMSTQFHSSRKIEWFYVYDVRRMREPQPTTSSIFQSAEWTHSGHLNLSSKQIQ